MEFPTVDDLLNHLEEMELAVITFDGLNDAIIGSADQGNNTVMVYDYEKVIEILAKEQGMGWEGAKDWYCTNMMDGFLNAPVVLDYKVTSSVQHPPTGVEPESQDG